jgi:iron complex outermembrane recepter protein
MRAYRGFLMAITSAGALAIPSAWAQSNAPSGSSPAPASSSAPAEPEEQLDEVVVNAYLRRDAQSAMKLDIPIRDTPFSVSSYSESYLTEIEATTTLDAYAYMTGVSRGGQSAWDLSLRGFKTTSNDRNAIVGDGLPGQSSRFASPSTAAVDRIEVVKGPASVLYGKAQPGGFVNIISKKPERERAARFGLRANSYSGDKLDLGDANGLTFSADFTGPIDSGERFLYRLIGEYSDRDSFRDFSSGKSTYVAPSITWNVSDATVATLALEYREVEGSYDLYLAAPARDVGLLAPITTRYQEPGDFQDERGYLATFTLQHEFANEAVWRLGARMVRNTDFTQWFDHIGVLANNRTLQRRARIGDNHRINDYLDTSFSIPFQTGSVEHRFLVGATVGRDSLDANRKQFVNGAATGALSVPGPNSLNIDIYNPMYGVSPTHASLPAGTIQRRFTQAQVAGFYLTDFITLSPKWKATLGLRYDQEKQLFRDKLPVRLPDIDETDSDIYPMAGLLFQPNESWSFYGSFSTSFVPPPPNFQDVTGAHPFDPEIGEQFEVGAKAYLAGGKAVFTLAWFDIAKENTLAVVACNAGVAGTCHREVGEEVSDGLEFEANLAPIPNWQTTLGYARVNAKVSKADTATNVPLVGSQLTNAPRDNAHLWTRYDVVGGPLAGLGLALGVIHVSGQPGNSPTRANPRILQLPSYTVVDLAAYYTLAERYDVGLKIGNAFDERYYDSVGSTLADVSVVPGAPRNVTLSLNVKF